MLLQCYYSKFAKQKIIDMEKEAKEVRKAPVRSTMSDHELASIIRRDRESRPSEFSTVSHFSSSRGTRHFGVSSAVSVIEKWL